MELMVNTKKKDFLKKVLARREKLDEEMLHPVGGAITNVGSNPSSSDRISQFRISKLLTVCRAY